MYGLKAVPFKDSFPSLPGPAERVFNPLYVPAEARKWVPQRLKSLRENSHLPASVPQGRMKLPRTTPISATLFWVFFVKLATKSSSCLPRLAVGAKRLTDLSRDTGLVGAQSKDLEDAHLTHAARTFSTTEARERDLRNVDVAYGTQQDSAALVLGPPRERPWPLPLDAGFGG